MLRPVSGEAPPSAAPPAPRETRTGQWWLVAGGGIAAQLVMTVNGVLAARVLGVEGRGQMVLATILAAAASQLTLGGSLPNAVTHQLAARGISARDGLRGLVGRWVVWGTLAGAAAAGCLLALERDELGSTAIWLLAFLVLVLAVEGMASRILVGAMMGEGAPLVHVALTGLLPQLMILVVLAVVVVFGFSWSAAAVISLSAVFTAVVFVGRLRLLAPRTPGTPPLDRAELGSLARRTHIGSVGPIDGLGIDRILVGSLLGNVALGLYSAAFALGGLATIFGVCLGMVALPRITQLQKDPASERHFVRRWLLLSAGLMVAMVLALEVTMEPLIRYTFGTAFLPAVDVGRWLVVGLGLLGYRRILVAVLQGRGSGGYASLVELGLTPVMVGGIVWAAMVDSQVAAGVTMTVVGGCACAILLAAVCRPRSSDAVAAGL